ncbi:MAG: right-handed parallel beta-helix repeat-containing protein [Thermoguttaceae bacterium]|nr:right-handed parallel beta-helix repeat-containing protein [Thermoguttaceae bacterium]
MFVHDGASGTFTDCEASGNANAGIVVQDSGTAPTVRGCQILNNHGTGILVLKPASGIFRNNRLSGNAKAWDVGWFSSVVREGNVPNSNWE